MAYFYFIFFLHLKKTPSKVWLSKVELTLPNTLTFETKKLNISQNCNKLKREKNINNENYVRHLASCCTKDQKKEVYMLFVVFFLWLGLCANWKWKKLSIQHCFVSVWELISVLGDRKENISLNFHLNFMSDFGQEAQAFIVSALVPLPVLLNKDKVHNMI